MTDPLVIQEPVRRTVRKKNLCRRSKHRSAAALGFRRPTPLLHPVMAGQRRRSKGKLRSDTEDDAVIILSSSDDEEANRDLSLEIVEKARKRKRADEKPRASAQLPVIDLTSASSDDVEAAPPPEAEPSAKKSKKKKKKKKAVVENMVEEVDVNPIGTAGTADTKEAPVKEEDGTADTKEAPVKEEDAVMGTGDSGITEAAETPVDNAVLRKLLRGPRYFDPPEDRIVDTCYNCGEEGHRAVDCGMERRQKPCFVCGMFGHVAKQCTQGQDCYICKRRGHVAKNCPDKGKLISQDSKICLRCGDIGHEMNACKNNYAPEDLKEIQCYICKKYGHLCCVNLTFPAPEEVSCYNCARSGHIGVGCAKKKSEASTEASRSLCYKCGEAGHLARGCRTIKSNHWKGESSTPNRFSKKKSIDSPGYKSLPHDIGKSPKRKNLLHEDGRNNTSPRKSRAKGGWSADDPNDLPDTGNKANRWKSGGWSAVGPDELLDTGNKANRWKSPKTPARRSPKVQSMNSSRPSSSSQSPWKKYKSSSGTPMNTSMSTYNQNGFTSSSVYQHGYSVSRYSNSQGHRRW